MIRKGITAPIVTGMEVSPAPNPLIEYTKKKVERRENDTKITLSGLEEELREFTARIQHTKDEIAGIEKTLAEIEGRTVDEEALNRMYASIMRHKMVESVSSEGGDIKITTRLVFTDIRTGSGSRTSKRRCLGSFSIMLGNDATRIRVMQNLFTGGYAHWATPECRTPYTWIAPCLGDWYPMLQKMYDENDLYAVVDTLYHYLRDTNDSGAYIRSHDWVNMRKLPVPVIVPTKKAGEVLKLGDHVVCIVDEFDGVRALGQFGVVVHIQSPDQAGEEGSLGIEFKALLPNGGHDCEGRAEEGHGWFFYPSDVTKITKELYDSGTGMGDTKEIKKIAEQVDELPEWSTLADAQKLYVKN